MDEPPEDQPVRVTEIVNGKRRMRLIRLSDGRDFIFSDEACAQHGLEVGMEASDDLLASLDAAEQHIQAHEAALRLLSQRSRSENEMRTRLRMRGIDPGIVEDEIARLRDAGLLDDDRFATAWVADRQRMAPRGRRMLRYELLGRGVAPEAVDRATQEIDDLAIAMAAARARARKIDTRDYQEFATRVGGYLQRRGFSYDVVMEATRAAWLEATEGAADDEQAATLT